MDKFQDYYRIPSARASWSEYNLPGTYFITICTAYRECSLGIIERDRIQLSKFGKIVLQEWEKSFVIREELSCDIVVIMPNHIHAILRIKDNPKEISSQ